jgi:hypothetical protein
MMVRLILGKQGSVDDIGDKIRDFSSEQFPLYCITCFPSIPTLELQAS